MGFLARALKAMYSFVHCSGHMLGRIFLTRRAAWEGVSSWEKRSPVPSMSASGWGDGDVAARS
jgi:hypothetical protein